jgi:glycine betaine/proline transport system ATP-binding protein
MNQRSPSPNRETGVKPLVLAEGQECKEETRERCQSIKRVQGLRQAPEHEVVKRLEAGADRSMTSTGLGTAAVIDASFEVERRRDLRRHGPVRVRQVHPASARINGLWQGHLGQRSRSTAPTSRRSNDKEILRKIRSRAHLHGVPALRPAAAPHRARDNAAYALEIRGVPKAGRDLERANTWLQGRRPGEGWE